ncbi:MAG: FYDLN acid domain-containing protein [Xanthobacteraceae bacterium]|nr:FYDLN acid domain-containing protein [Xanthobacteraceae bacterium]MBX3533625.1 FYDLN acid domain-containing protein [Xanthobacteraceae bacterium]MCW5675740.1 FYDLN acid domain-containing protein [Xanthobacteraceae bacterium]MCW5679213.1 FYDLN acid domain-containing protein [Xanthobacteraceae bacterium]
MSKPIPAAGTKRRCLSCGAKFYDLDKRPVVCPKCDAELADLVTIVS